MARPFSGGRRIPPFRSTLLAAVDDPEVALPRPVLVEVEPKPHDGAAFLEGSGSALREARMLTPQAPGVALGPHLVQPRDAALVEVGHRPHSRRALLAADDRDCARHCVGRALGTPDEELTTAHPFE